MVTEFPKRVRDRIAREIPRFQEILEDDRNRDIHESGSATVVTDMPGRVFGLDKYTEVTSEHAIKSTFLDQAVKLDGSVKYLIEVKAIGLDLNENHLRQTENFGASEGIPW